MPDSHTTLTTRKPVAPAIFTPARIIMAVAGVTLAATLVIAAAMQPATLPAAPAAPAAPAGPAGVIRHGLAAPLPRMPGTIRLATYNIENLFDDKDDPTLSGEQEDKEMTKPLAHREAVAAAIKAIDADVIALQEIESLQALTWFRDTHLQGLGYDHIASLDSGDGRGIECSVISRFPIIESKVYAGVALGGMHPAKWGNEENRDAGQPVVFRRSPLLARIVIPAEKIAKLAAVEGSMIAKDVPSPESAKPYELDLFVIHFKSGRPGGYWREAEARKTGELANEVLKANAEANVVILGDFNAQMNEEPMKILAKAGWNNLLADRAARDSRTTTHSSDRTIDHVLYSSTLSGEMLFPSRFVLGTMNRPSGQDWRTTPPPAGYAADHYPLVVDIAPVNRAESKEIPTMPGANPAAASSASSSLTPTPTPAKPTAEPAK